MLTEARPSPARPLVHPTPDLQSDPRLQGRVGTRRPSRARGSRRQGMSKNMEGAGRRAPALFYKTPAARRPPAALFDRRRPVSRSGGGPGALISGDGPPCARPILAEGRADRAGGALLKHRADCAAGLGEPGLPVPHLSGRSPFGAAAEKPRRRRPGALVVPDQNLGTPPLFRQPGPVHRRPLAGRECERCIGI